MSEVQIGHGAEFWLGNSSNVLTELAEVNEVTPPNPETADVDVTHFKSPDRRREYIAGLIEDGEGVFGMNYIPGSPTDILIREAQTAGEVRDYKIVLPTSTGTWEITGQCIVKGYERNVPIDDKLGARMTVRFTGASDEEAGA